MRRICIQLIISITVLTICVSGFGQSSVDTLKTVSEIVDSLKNAGLIFTPVQEKPNIELTADEAVKFLERYSQSRFWHNANNPLRKAIEQLLFLATQTPYGSSEAFLKNYEYDSIKIPWEEFYVWDTLKFKIPDIEPVSFQTADSAHFETDTINVAAESDSAAVFPRGSSYDIFSENTVFKDTSIIVIKDTLRRVFSSNPNLPFRYYNNLLQIDSLETAVNSLIKFLGDRDSTLINFAGRGDAVVPVWFNSKSNNMMRYWLKNEFNDSVTVWIGNIGRDTIGLFAEQGIGFRRTIRATTNNTEARVNVERQDRSRLLELQTVNVRKKLWKYKTETNLAFNQTGLWNWVKGGEKSLSSLLDITGYADFDNKEKKLSSNNFVRLKLGFIASGDNPIRKNTDIFESNSKLNHKAFGKFDFSAIALFKTQLLKGYDYSKNDSIPVSKFLNPAAMTLGFGLDYKPNAQTSINFSPLSYKLTFILDTINFDQTKHGIAKGHKAMHEPGINFMISNVWKPSKITSFTNRLQLFSNYIDKPLNIDVDWELTMATKLNWFTELRVNTHLLFSDNIKTPVLDKDKPVLNPDGTEKKTARIQFKEMIGLSLAFVF